MAEIKNLIKTANRIKKAIRNQERIILYGDTDLDGVTSVIILKEILKNLNYSQEVVIYFPDREIEGYGISEIGLKYLKQFAPALLIALDCGIGNFKEVKMAKKMGFEIIIIDHHEVLDGLPEAEIIVDPKQKEDKYPFKGLATVGIVFKLSEILLKEQLSEGLRRNFLELTALATIADMMPRENDNLEFIEEGLKSLENSWRPGIKAFFKMEIFRANFGAELNLSQKVSKIISLLNVREGETVPRQSPGRGLPVSFRLLDSSSFEESEKLIEKLIENGKVKKERLEVMVAEIEERIKKETSIIFEGDANWEFALISSAASIICNKYQKPTFIFKSLEKESQGAVRTPKEVNSVALMKKCQKYPITYGGHPQASGFRIKNKNLEKFKTCLIKFLKE